MQTKKATLIEILIHKYLYYNTNYILRCISIKNVLVESFTYKKIKFFTCYIVTKLSK